MKILSIIFATLTILIGIGPIMRDTSVASKIEKEMREVTSVSPELAKEAMKKSNLPSTGSLYFAMVIVLVIILVSIAGIILAIKNNPKIKLIGFIIMGLAVLSVILHPSIDLGILGGASPRAVAVIHGIPAMLTGFFMFLFSVKLNTTIT